MKTKKPHHVAIIMDGNGRWAQQRGRPRSWGHIRGAKRVKEIVRFVNTQTNIKVLTIWGYSTDNEKRTNVVDGGINEVQALMKIFYRFIVRNTDEMVLENVRVTLIGDLSRLAENVQRVARDLVNKTARNDGLHLQVAVGYGGEDEITRAVKKMLRDTQAGLLYPEQVTFAEIRQYLDTTDVIDPDLIIRTSGELRSSGFLPLQSMKSEWVYLKTLWPDFTSEDLRSAIKQYSTRDRRFGAVTSNQVAR